MKYRKDVRDAYGEDFRPNTRTLADVTLEAEILRLEVNALKADLRRAKGTGADTCGDLERHRQGGSVTDYIVEVEIQILERHRFAVSAEDEAEARHRAEDYAAEEYDLYRFDNPWVRALKCEIERF